MKRQDPDDSDVSNELQWYLSMAGYIIQGVSMLTIKHCSYM